MMTTSSINPASLAARLARPELLNLEPYQSARRIGGVGHIWINANESPFNRSDVKAANLYPECQPAALIAAYAAYAGVEPQQLVCGRGADEAIELLVRTFCVPATDSIGIFSPTYGMYAISAATFNVAVKNLPLAEDFTLPADLSPLAGCKLVFVCNPNNPTGTLLPLTEIARIARRFADSLVVVDEAYIEFARHLDGNAAASAVGLMSEFPNLVVLRTLSKAFGLAGARCGFLLAQKDVCDLVMRVIAPYPVPVPVSALAEKALTADGIAQMREDVSFLLGQGMRLKAALEGKGLRVLDSGGNYVLAFSQDIEALADSLTQAGIVARRYAHPRLTHAIRFSFSSGADTDAIIEALASVNIPAATAVI